MKEFNRETLDYFKNNESEVKRFNANLGKIDEEEIKEIQMEHSEMMD